MGNNDLLKGAIANQKELRAANINFSTLCANEATKQGKYLFAGLAYDPVHDSYDITASCRTNEELIYHLERMIKMIRQGLKPTGVTPQ